MKSRSDIICDTDTYPVSEVRETLRNFGSKYGYNDGHTLSMVLEIPEGTIERILYSRSAKNIKGSTKQMIEKRIRSHDPSICPHRIIEKEKFQKVLLAFQEEYGLKKSEMARILEVPQSTLKSWLARDRSRDFRAKIVRPALVKMREHRINNGVRIKKAMDSQC